MARSGTKVVIGLAVVALAAGMLSWWYQYTATHRATQFWGPEAAGLIARRSQVEVLELRLASSADAIELNSASELNLGRPYLFSASNELTNARGMVHFRHVLMSDRSYEWGEAPNPAEISWRWCFRFHDSNEGEIAGQAMVVLAKDLGTIGVVDNDSQQVKTLSCAPLRESLEHYFRDLGLIAASTAR